MAAILLPNGKQQFIDIDGKPLVGGSVAMYYSGTLRYKNTWQNSGETVLNTNPIILDSRGQAIIYGLGVYRQIVKDAAGNTIWDEHVSSGTGTLNGIYDLLDYGAVGDGITDCYAAIVAAFADMSANGGGTLYVPPGTFAIVSSTSSSIQVPNNCTVQGVGKNQSVFKVTGVSQINALFLAKDPQNVWFQDVGIYGNSNGSSGAAGAIEFLGSTTATGVMSNFGCRRVTISNFQQTYWIYVINESAYEMNTIRFIEADCYSYFGNMLNPASVNEPSCFIGVIGQYLNLSGVVRDVVIDRGYGDCHYIKTYSVFWSGVKDAWQTNSIILNAGQNASDNAASYGTFAYNLDPGSIGADDPTRVTWRGNTILNPRSNGIYNAGITEGVIDGNIITGQSDTTTAVPDVKAAIGFGNAKDLVITNNILIDNYKGVEGGGAGATTIKIQGNVISSTVANAFGIRIKDVSGLATAATQTNLDNNDISLTGSGSIGVEVLSVSGTSSNPGFAKISGGGIAAVGTDISSFDSTTGGGAVSAGIVVNNVFLAGGGASSTTLNHSATATSLIVRNVTIDGTNFTATSNGLAIPTATNVTIDGLTLQNKNAGGGYMISCDGAHGTMANVTFNNVASGERYTTTTFGIAAPSYSYSLGGFVQNLNPVEAGSAGSKYIVKGWSNTSGSTTWNDNRVLTGN